MSRTRVRAGRVGALVAGGALVVALAGRAAGGPAPGRDQPPAQGPVAGQRAAVARHVVRPGDTLWAIARARVGPQGDPRPLVQELLEANGLRSAVLQPGVTLVVPPTP